MADVRITPQIGTAAGIAPSYTSPLSAADRYQVRNGGRLFLHFLKTAAVDAVVTIETPITVGGLAVAERTVTVPATTGNRIIGPFPQSVYNDGAQDINFTCSNIDGLSVAAIQL